MGPISPPVPKGRLPPHPSDSWHRSRFPLRTPPKTQTRCQNFLLSPLPARSPLCDLGGRGAACCAGQGLAPRPNPTRRRDGFARDACATRHLQEGRRFRFVPRCSGWWQGTSAPVVLSTAVPPPQSHTLFKVQRLPSTCCSEQIKGEKRQMPSASGRQTANRFEAELPFLQIPTRNQPPLRQCRQRGPMNEAEPRSEISPPFFFFLHLGRWEQEEDNPGLL